MATRLRGLYSRYFFISLLRADKGSVSANTRDIFRLVYGVYE